jgi:prephenate dehydratase
VERRIGFQGEPGAFSHLACRTWYPDHAPLPCETFEQAFAAVRSGEVELALLPLENSIAGEVPEVAEGLRDGGLTIVGDHRLPIRMHLMGRPEARLSGLRTVASHAMALRQCARAIRRLGLEPEVALDTAGAARLVAEGRDDARGAIASEAAAQLYGLTIFERDVQDTLENTTRFLALTA